MKLPCGNCGDCYVCRLYATDEAFRITMDHYPEQVVTESPSLLQRAANFAGAMVRHVANGMKTLPQEETRARLAVCQLCDKFVKPHSCMVCTCNLNWKASMASEHCPLKKWPGD